MLDKYIMRSNSNYMDILVLVIVLVILFVPTLVGIHKGGGKIDWFLIGLALPMFSWIWAYWKAPRGLWRFVLNYATESDFLEHRMKFSSKHLDKTIGKMGKK